ncbi:MAG: putative 2-aminoethylphosphonate ABC transporter ATP-binding protein [Desulfobacterales bacterium]|nr:putative 2-aminoethylphosphonate ABC transporter ATP-binding protein [Desulfobacterales bacterium]
MKNDSPGISPCAHLSVMGLSKAYGKFEALSNINLEVSKGEFVCFLGPSGCGKTTLLRTIAGLTAHEAGRIWLGGKEITHLPVDQRDFGIVFQSYALFPNLTVGGNVGYGLEAEGRLNAVERKSRVAELLSLVGLPDAGMKFPAELSGGEQQRVALARALATSPSLLLLDEPLSALDARVRQRLRVQIKALQKRINVTTIMVTHDQEEALTMADRIVVMNKGRIEQIGTPHEIYNNPASAFVADFVGTMNVIAAESMADRTLGLPGLRLQYQGELTAGEHVTLCLRPEDVALLHDSATVENACESRVLALEFLGSSYRALVEVVPGGVVLSIGLSVPMVRSLSIAVGSVIRIALPAQHLRIFHSRPEQGAVASPLVTH